MRPVIDGFILGAILFVILCAIVAGGLYLATGGQIVDQAQVLVLRIQLASRQTELDAPFSSQSNPIRFTIPPGAGAYAIASSLYDAALIHDPQLFIDYARVQGYDRRFEAGVYFLNQAQSIRQIAGVLTDSSKSFISFRMLEGARIEELAGSIDQNGLFDFTGAEFLALVSDGAAHPEGFTSWADLPPGASLEGFMFPDTYQLPPDISPSALRDTLLRTFSERVGETLRAEALAQNLTLYQVVTLASIVEREAVWRDEHALIASVYRNRFDIDMPLEADPTVQYGLQGARASWWPQITQADYREVDSPYNTYLHAGLPPGPIASPSLSAIQAAIHPESSDFFYFRAACDNSHYHNFARTFDEHLRNAC